MTVTVALDPEDVFAGGVFEGDFGAHGSKGRKVLGGQEEVV